MAEHNDQELEELFRRELGRHAEAMNVTVPVVSGARATAARRRQGQTLAGVAAAVAAVAVTGFMVARGDSGRTAEPPVADRTSEEPTAVVEWRTEYWLGLQVDVPADWAWGAAPVRSGNDLIRCGGPDDNTTPYVGRPIAHTDVCQMVKHLEVDAPYAWLGADLEPGVVELDNGYTQETVEVAGTTLTVATDDPGLRETILGSASGGELCSAALDRVPDGRSDVTFEGVGDLEEALVCAYSDLGGDGYELVAASSLARDRFKQMEEAIHRAPAHPVQCKHVPEVVVVTGWYDDPNGDQRLRHDRVFELVCGVVDRGLAPMLERDERVRATPETIEAWRAPVYEATLSHFIGPQG